MKEVEDEIWEYNEQHSDTFCRCQVKLKIDRGKQEANHMLSYASCMIPAHEYGCAKETELVHGQYWQCEECRELHKTIYPAYKTLHQPTFENIHKKKTMGHKHVNKHEKNTEQKQRKTAQVKEKTERPKNLRKRAQLTKHGGMTPTRCTQKTETHVLTNLRKLIKNRGTVVSVLAAGHCLFRAIGEILYMEPGTVMKEAEAHMISRP